MKTLHISRTPAKRTNAKLYSSKQEKKRMKRLVVKFKRESGDPSY